MRQAEQRNFALNEWRIIWPSAGGEQNQNRRHLFSIYYFCFYCVSAKCESTENARDDIVILLLTRRERSRGGGGDVMVAGS